MEPEIYILSNGLKVLHLHFPESKVAHCAFMINSGTRDEPEDLGGIAHFTEHAIFKGTRKRKPFHILTRIDAVGGELNAYTAKEETALHASFTKEHTARAIELMSDILLESTFPEKEIIKERAVIIDEIFSYQDSPSEQIFDDFEEMIFGKHPISRNILGTVDSLNNITNLQIKDFFNQHYTADNMLVCYAGPAKPAELKKMLEKYTEGLDRKLVKPARKKFTAYKPEFRSVDKSVNLAHIFLGGTSLHQYHDQRIAMVLLNNLLGGPAMNSRLNLNVREKYGFAYTIESSYTAYTDTGSWGIYAATDPKHTERLIDLSKKELKKLRDQSLGVLQLSLAKQQLYGQIALARENKLGLMLALGKSMLHDGKIETLEEVLDKISRITVSDILEVANEVYSEKNISTLIYNPA